MTSISTNCLVNLHPWERHFRFYMFRGSSGSPIDNGAFSNIYLRCKCNPNQNPSRFLFLFLVETDGLIRKFIWKYREPGKAKAASSAFCAGQMPLRLLPPGQCCGLAFRLRQETEFVVAQAQPCPAVRGSQLGCRLRKTTSWASQLGERLAVICWASLLGSR